jgi:DNA helicase-2/ATP-dependent DNA helicase PcrA
MELSETQRKAVEICDGALVVLAGPGAGKTRVIIEKIKHLARSGIKPERVLALTFSQRATAEMMERLESDSPRIAELVEISTIHSWCADLVRRQSFRLGFPQSISLMSESQARLLLRDILGKIDLKEFLKTASAENLIDPLLQLFSKMKDQGLWPEDLMKIEEGEWNALGQIALSFQTQCHERGFIDFGDAILFALRLLSDNAEMRSEVQNAYDVILVDEFQDTNWTQVQLLRLIAGPKTHVAIVGDDDQSIYRFRGASYSAFQFFEEAFPGCQSIELTETFRLSPEIASVANQLIHANGERRYRPNKKLKALGQSAGFVQVLELASFEDEALEILDQIEARLADGASPGDCAVLVRAHSHAHLITAEAKRRGVPVQVLSQEGLWEREIVQDFVSFLNLLHSPQSLVDFLRLCDSPLLEFSEAEIVQMCRWFEGKPKSVFALENMEGLQISDPSRERLVAFFQTYSQAKAHWARKPLSETLSSWLEVSGFVKRHLELRGDDIKSLGLFVSQIREWEKLQVRSEGMALFPYLNELFRTDSALEQNHLERDNTRVSVLTLHASKGLEFDSVWIPSLVGRRFPLPLRKDTWELPTDLLRDAPLTKELHQDEERRLLYVGITRAKRKLCITTVNKKGVKPSSFVTEDLAGLSQEVLRTEAKPARPVSDFFLQPAVKVFQRTQANLAEKPPSKEKALSLSFSQLETYQRCPLKYRFQYDLRIPQLESPHLSYGNAVHAALEAFFKKLQVQEVPSSEDLQELFSEAWKKELAQAPDLPARLSDLGRSQLAEFYSAQQAMGWPQVVAIEESFRIKVGPHTVRGKIDRADRVSSGIEIVDYKTGKSKGSGDEKDQKFADESLQFSIYALAAREFFDWPLSQLSFYYLADQSRLSTTRSPESDAKTKNEILEIAEGIQSQTFEPKPSQPVCRSCEYQRLCPASAA